MRQTHELVKDAIRWHVSEAIGSKHDMPYSTKHEIANDIVDYIDPNGDLSAAPSALNTYIGQYGQPSNVMRLGQLIKNMVREELVGYTMHKIDMQLNRNKNAGQ